MRIRHYGFLANRYRQQKLAQIRQCLEASDEEPQVPSEPVATPLYATETNDKLQTCPKSKAASWQVVAEIMPRRIHNEGSMKP